MASRCGAIRTHGRRNARKGTGWPSLVGSRNVLNPHEKEVCGVLELLSSKDTSGRCAAGRKCPAGLCPVPNLSWFPPKFP